MEKRIIYINEAGGVSVISPSPDSGLTLQEVATRDVPTGLPYKIVDVVEVPTDRSARALWAIDPATLTDGVGG